MQNAFQPRKEVNSSLAVLLRMCKGVFFYVCTRMCVCVRAGQL